MKCVSLLIFFFISFFNHAIAQQKVIHTLDKHDRIIRTEFPDSLILKRTFDKVSNINTEELINPCFDRPDPIIQHSSPLIFCEGDSAILTAPESIQYLWSTEDTTRSITIRKPGSYFVTTTGTLHCIKVSSPVEVIVRSPLSVTSNGETTICVSEKAILTASGTGGDSLNHIYSWNNGAGSGDTVIVSPAITTTYKVTLWDSCTVVKAEDSVTVTVHPPLAVSADSSTAICFGESATLRASGTGGDTSKYIYSWDNGAGSGKSVTVSPVVTTTFHITLSDSCTTDKAIDSVTITVNPLPKLNFSINDSIQCLAENQFIFTNSSTIPSGTVSSYLWKFGDDSISSATDPIKTYQKEGAYTITLIAVSNNSCVDSVKKQVTIFPNPKTSFTYVTHCLDSAATFTNTSTLSSGSISAYQWKFGDGTTSSLKNPSHKYQVAGKYEVKLISTTSEGCVDSASETIDIYPKPRVSWTASNDCVYDTLTFNNSSEIDSPYTIAAYLWDFGDQSSSSLKSPIYKYSTPGIYSVKLTVTSNKGCIDSLRKSITVYPQPAASFNFVNRCADSAISFFNTSSVLTGSINSYLWDFGDSITSTSSSPTHLFSKDGNFTVKLICESDKGCRDSVSKTVTVHTLPKADFSFADDCILNPISFKSNSSIQIGKIDSFYWDFGDGTTASVSNPQKTYLAVDTYQVTLIVTSNEGCRDSVKKDITIHPRAKPAFTYSTHCFDSAVIFTNTSSISGGSITSYLWGFGDGLISSATNPDHIYANAGTYAVKLITTTDKGCKDSTDINITVYPKPSVLWVASNDCLDNIFSFSDSSVVSSPFTIASHFWDFGDNTSSTDSDPKHKFSAAGIYSVKLAVTTNKGCVDSFRKQITVYPEPVADFSVNPNCQDSVINFINNSVIASGKLTYSWDFGDNSSNSTDPNPSHNYSAAGTYSVKLTAKSDSGCIDSIRKQVTVYSLPVISFTNDTVCAYDSVAFSSNISISSGTIASVEWDFGDASTSTLYNPKHKYVSAGTYLVKLTAISDKGCPIMVSNSITVLPIPKAEFTSDTVCEGDPTTFTNLSFGVNIPQALNYIWKFGDGVTSTDIHPQHVFAKYGDYKVSLLGFNASGCLDSTSVNIHVWEHPIAAFSISNICAGLSQQFSLSNPMASDSVTSYLWSFGDGNVSSDPSPGHSYDSPGEYTISLEVTSSKGCSDSIARKILIFANPVSDFSFTKTCLSRATNFNNNDQTASNKYAWNFGDGRTSANSNPVHTYADTGDYTVTLTVTTDSGCVDKTTKIISVYARPVADFMVSDVCIGTPTVFTNNSTIAKDSIKSYWWNLGSGFAEGNEDEIYTFPKPGIYPVTLVAIANNGCSDTITKYANVYAVPQARFKTENVCLGEPVQFFDSSKIDTGTLVSWTWNFGDGSSSNQKNPTHLYSVNGNYTVSLKTITKYGCSDSISNQVSVYGLPNAQFIASNVHEGEFSFTPMDTTLFSYKWDFGDSTKGTMINSHHTYSPDGVYEVKLTVVDSNLCSASFLQSITVKTSGISPGAKDDFNIKLYPNPFKDQFTLTYELKKPSKVRITILDMSGKEVLVVVDENQEVGPYNFLIEPEINNLAASAYIVNIVINGSLYQPKIIRSK